MEGLEIRKTAYMLRDGKWYGIVLVDVREHMGHTIAAVQTDFPGHTVVCYPTKQADTEREFHGVSFQIPEDAEIPADYKQVTQHQR